MESAACRSCGGAIRFRRAVRVGERFACPACGARQEVLSLTPLELDWAFDGPIDEIMSGMLFEESLGDGDPAVA